MIAAGVNVAEMAWRLRPRFARRSHRETQSLQASSASYDADLANLAKTQSPRRCGPSRPGLSASPPRSRVRGRATFDTGWSPHAISAGLQSEGTSTRAAEPINRTCDDHSGSLCLWPRAQGGVCNPQRRITDFASRGSRCTSKPTPNFAAQRDQTATADRPADASMVADDPQRLGCLI